MAGTLGNPPTQDRKLLRRYPPVGRTPFTPWPIPRAGNAEKPASLTGRCAISDLALSPSMSATAAAYHGVFTPQSPRTLTFLLRQVSHAPRILRRFSAPAALAASGDSEIGVAPIFLRQAVTRWRMDSSREESKLPSFTVLSCRVRRNFGA